MPETQEELKGLSPSQWRSIRPRLDRAVEDLGLAFTAAKPTRRRKQSIHGWRIEPVPLLLGAPEWSVLNRAVQQRTRLLNALMADIYGERRLLRNNLVPAELIMSDPAFRRPCVGMPGTANREISVVRFDLYKHVERGWTFLANYTNTPIGITYAVQNRRLLTQEAPDYYADLGDYQRIIDYPIQLLETLKSLSPRDSDAPHIVVLTSGPDDPAYFEHSFIARKMGLPLVQGDDLLVVDNRVYLKTIAGIEQVDVIYRRLNDAHIDPMVFDTTRVAAGVPGLLGCLRAGTVAMANPVGAGVFENRALPAFLEPLCRHFLGESLLLPSEPVWYCGDVDQLDHVIDAAADLAVGPVHLGPFDPPILQPGSSPSRIKRYLKDVGRRPHQFIARPPLQPVPHPNPHGYGIGQAGTVLSLFALCRHGRVDVMPGGLARLMPITQATEPPPWEVARTVDVIVDTSTDAPTEPPGALRHLRTKPLVLGSTAAERLYWTGRYAERGEACARMLSILEDVGLEEMGPAERTRWFPIWTGVLEATGHLEKGSKPSVQKFSQKVVSSMVLDTDNPNSILASVRSARENVRLMRDFFSPETWSLINRLHEEVERHSTEAANAPGRRRDLTNLTVTRTLEGLSAFFGTAERTMLHDAGWQFLTTGIHLERAIITCSSLRHGLTEAEAAARLGRPEESDLTALVRMLSSQDAYRRTYQSRSEPLFVAELFLTSTDAPKSIRFCVQKISESLERVFGSNAGEQEPFRQANDCLEQLHQLNLESYFEQRANSPRLGGNPGGTTPAAKRPPLSETLKSLLETLNQLGISLQDHFFSHHARVVPVEAGVPFIE